MLRILRLDLLGEERGQLRLHADEDLLSLFVRPLPTRSTRREAFWKCSTFHEARLNALTMGRFLLVARAVRLRASNASARPVR